jgi:glycosyltransferase involved in cell wall biosynthesis
MIRLQVLICTIGEDGINRVLESTHPRVEGVEYLVSWQQPEESIEIPEQLRNRDDFQICITNSRGICKNRNHAIQCATSPYCLMSDDDVCYQEEELKALISAFEKNSDVDIITVKFQSENYPKEYVDYSFDLKNPPKGYYVTCFEIAFRLASVKDKVRFNENISIGTPVLRCGEEDVFVYDAMRAKLKLRFIPIVVGTHNHSTTGDRDWYEPYFWMVKGAIFRYIHRNSWLPRIVVNAWRASKKSGKPMFFFLKHAFAGMTYAKKNKVFES